MQLVLAAGQERTLQCSGSSRRLCPSVCLFICLFVCIACRNARDLNNYFFSSLTYPFLTTTRRALQYEGARTLCKHYVEKHYHQQAGSVSMRHGARLVSVTRCHRWRAPIPMTRDKGALISVPISLSLSRARSLSLSGSHSTTEYMLMCAIPMTRLIMKVAWCHPGKQHAANAKHHL